MIHFLDTSALKWAYISGKHHYRCRQIIGKLKGEVFIAEISILELVSALGSCVRDGRITVPQYEHADSRFFEDLAEDKLLVRAFPARNYIHCRQLLTLVGIHERRALKTQDSMIAYTARELGIERKRPVKLLTSDKRMASAIISGFYICRCRNRHCGVSATALKNTDTAIFLAFSRRNGRMRRQRKRRRLSQLRTAPALPRGALLGCGQLRVS